MSRIIGGALLWEPPARDDVPYAGNCPPSTNWEPERIFIPLALGVSIIVEREHYAAFLDWLHGLTESLPKLTRALRTCGTCGGDGWWDLTLLNTTTPCRDCNGTGQVLAEPVSAKRG